jgi:hypothetical protein
MMTRDFSTIAKLTPIMMMVMPALAAAQPELPPPAVVPPAWTVSTNEAAGTVKIAATAKSGGAQFTGGCNKSSEPGILGAFSGYRGSALRADGEVQRVAFYVRGGEWQDLFSVPLRYSAASGTWEFEKPIAPVFLSSFSRGATLAVVVGNEEVFAFDLTGSATAAKAMRAVCGIE